MNCREAQPQIFAERDGALDNLQRAALDGHLAQCDACRRIRDDLAAALTVWRTEVVNVTVPDSEREWHAVRRRIQGGPEAGAERTSRPRRNPFTWMMLPLGAVGAAAVAFFVIPTNPPPAAPDVPLVAQTARADSVEAPGNNASTMVFVDDKSGWLIVWASDARAKRG